MRGCKLAGAMVCNTTALRVLILRDLLRRGCEPGDKTRREADDMRGSNDDGCKNASKLDVDVTATDGSGTTAEVTDDNDAESSAETDGTTWYGTGTPPSEGATSVPTFCGCARTASTTSIDEGPWSCEDARTATTSVDELVANRQRSCRTSSYHSEEGESGSEAAAMRQHNHAKTETATQPTLFLSKHGYEPPTGLVINRVPVLFGPLFGQRLPTYPFEI